VMQHGRTARKLWGWKKITKSSTATIISFVCGAMNAVVQAVLIRG